MVLMRLLGAVAPSAGGEGALPTHPTPPPDSAPFGSAGRPRRVCDRRPAAGHRRRGLAVARWGAQKGARDRRPARFGRTQPVTEAHRPGSRLSCPGLLPPSHPLPAPHLFFRALAASLISGLSCAQDPPSTLPLLRPPPQRAPPPLAHDGAPSPFPPCPRRGDGRRCGPRHCHGGVDCVGGTAGTAARRRVSADRVGGVVGRRQRR